MIDVRHFALTDLANFREGDYTGWNERPMLVGRTLTDMNGKVLAVVGFQARWKGVADVWTVFTDDARGHGLDLLRMTRYFLNVLHEDFGFHRLNALVRDDRPEYQRWARLCGFVPENPMPGGGPDNVDVTGYVKCSDSLVAAATTRRQDQSTSPQRRQSLSRRGPQKPQKQKQKRLRGNVRASRRARRKLRKMTKATGALPVAETST